MSKTYQIIVIGEGSVGKSALCLRFVKGEFNIEYNPTIEDSYSKDINVSSGASVTLSIIDTAGQEEYISLREQYYIKGDGFVLVYSIDNRNSFNSLKTHRESILGLRTNRKTIMILAGNKCDLEPQRLIQTEDGQKLAGEWGIPFIETSACKDVNVTELFSKIAQLLFDSDAESTPAPKQEETQVAPQQQETQEKAGKKGGKKKKCVLL